MDLVKGLQEFEVTRGAVRRRRPPEIRNLRAVQMHKKLFTQKLTIFIAFVLVLTSFARADARPFSKLTDYLQNRFGNPLTLAGQVKEVSGDKVLFERKKSPLYNGQRLLVCSYNKDISPQLGHHVAFIRVDALFQKTVLAKVEKVIRREVKPKDWVLTPPSPSIYVYTNLKSKHLAEPYRELLKALLKLGFTVKEIPGDLLTDVLGPSDLLLRLELEDNNLVCRLLDPLNNSLLFLETQEWKGDAEKLYPVGHQIRFNRRSRSYSSPVKESRKREEPLTSGTGSQMPPGGPYSPKSERPLGVELATKRSDFHRLSKEFFRVVRSDLDGDQRPELTLLGKNGVAVYIQKDGQLVQQWNHSFGHEELFPLHLHAMDLNSDGKDELLVTLAKPVQVMDKEDNKLVSRILTLRDGELRCVVKQWPYYLRVIRDRKGRLVALAQKEGEYEQYSGPILEIVWAADFNTPKIKGNYKPAKNIYSIYQFNLVPGHPERVMILEPNGELHGYSVVTQKIEATGERNYGKFQEIVYPIKLEQVEFVGGFDQKRTSREVYAPRRFELRPELDTQCFFIYKGRPPSSGTGKIFKRLLGLNRGEDQVVGVKWRGARIIETWHSKKLAKDIVDFTFFHDPYRIVILYRDSDGYALESFY